MGSIRRVTRLPAGANVYLDANVLIYVLAGDPDWGSVSRDFLVACAEGEYRAFISDAVRAEVLVGPYRSGDRQALEAARRLVDDPDLFVLLPHTSEDFRLSAQLRGEQGLAFIDALHVATAQNNGCDVLLTNDRRLLTAGIPWIAGLRDA